MIKAVLFDFDGTVADSSEGIFHTALFTVDKLGIKKTYTDEELRRFVGPPLRRCFVEAFNLDESFLDDAVRIYRKEYSQTGMLMMHLYPGLEKLLIELKKLGIKTGIATFKTESLVRKCLANLGILHYFSTVHGSDEKGTLSKGDIINMTISELGEQSEDILMVGDTENDRKGAADAGVMFLGVTYGFGFDENTEGFDTVSAVPDILDYILRRNIMIERVETTAAPAAIGPYSQAVKANGMVFASGQIPIDPATGTIKGESAAEQAEQVFRNIKAVLKAAGTDITKVVKATVFLKSMDDFASVNEVYAKAFSEASVLPARSAVAVKTLPKDVQVEVEVIALA